MPIVFLVASISPEQKREIEKILTPGWSLVDGSQDRDLLTALGAEVEVVYGHVGQKDLSHLPNLKMVQATWAGIEGMLTPEMVESPIVLCNIRGAKATVMSEHVLGGLLYFTRSLGRHAGAEPLAWKAKRRDWPHLQLSGSKVCLFGAGSIGSALVPKLKALGCGVMVINRSGVSVEGADQTVPFEDAKSVLPECQHLVVLAASTPVTRGAIDGSFLRSQKPGGVLVNVSRGAIIVEDELIEVLDEGRLIGACLDVTSPEPPKENSPLYRHPQVLLTGHCSNKGGDMDVSPYDVFLHNLKCWVEGKTSEMNCVVAKEKGY